MSQNSIVISNGTGATVRAALNNALDSVATDFSGPSEPTTTWALMNWKDTTNKILKIRNINNTAWISLIDLETGAVLTDAGHNLDTNGYVVFGNGLMLEWGNIVSSSVGTYVFPVAFPTICFGVQVTTVWDQHHYVSNITNTQFTGDIQVGTTNKNAHWFAVGK
jgi:hypothetical protein